MKTKEDVEKEFDNFFPELLGKNYPLSVDGVFEAIDKMSPMILSHISKIRKDDIDGLVEWIGVKNKTYCQEDIFLRKSKPYDWHGYTHALHDVIEHLQVFKEKV